MKSVKRLTAILCVLLCALLLAGFADAKKPPKEGGANSVSGGGASEAVLHLEKNGHPLDLTLEKLAIEDGNIVITVKIDGISEWGDEEPPRMIVVCNNPSQKFKTSLFSSGSVKPNITNFKTTIKLPYDGSDLPDQILIDIGGEEPLVFWTASGDTDAPESLDERLDGASAAVARVKELIEDGEYYEAALAIQSCRDKYPFSRKECDALWDELAELLEPDRPKTGIIKRATQYEGRSELHINAESGDVEILVSNTENDEYVRFYVRKGEHIKVYLFDGRYRMTGKVGELWFGDETGFGRFGDKIETKFLEVNYKVNGAWGTFTKYEFTI